jgi:hypothetical protein
MTDAHDFDELASAHLDGATTPEEAALVASDPALQARVEELRAVRDAMREAPAVDPVRRDAAIAAALDAFDDDAAPGVPLAPATPIAPRRGLSPTAVRVLGVAAVFVLLALLVPLLSNLGDGGDADTASEGTSEELGDAEVDTGNDTAAEAPASPELTTTAPTPAAGGATPTYADIDALAEAVLAGDLAANRLSSQDDGVSQESAASCATPSTDTQVATAIVAGDPVIVWIRPLSDGTRRLTVLSADGCRVLDEREL